MQYTTTDCCSSDRCNEIPEPRTSKGVLSCFSGTQTLSCNFDEDECWTYRDIREDGGIITRSDCYRSGEFGMQPKCALGNRTIYGGIIRETLECCSTPNCNVPVCTTEPKAHNEI